jgi:arylsulfatase A-like enzyme
MKWKYITAWIIASSCVFCTGGMAADAAAITQPNVILIVTDDQGFGDLGCHGNPVLETPNLDRLHNESVRFTDFHVDPTCAPSRGALLTGKYAHRAGVWHTIAGGNHLRASEVTMADVFKASGYRTGLFGKWHLGSNYPYRPMDRGFDEWLGQGDGGTGTTDDWFDNDRVNDHYWHNGERVQRDGYAPDVFFDAAIDFISKNEQNDQPFFAYLATYMPHTPHTLPDQSWTKKYDTQVSKEEAYFFAGIDRIDQNIGRLRQVLEESGKAENTILIFMSDNGGTAGVKLFNAGMRGRKTQVYDGGHRVPFFMHWPKGKLKHGTDVSDLTAHIDLLPTLIDLCELSLERSADFDGRSFKQQLFQPDSALPERTLFVEVQRTFEPKPWAKTAGMTKRWRLVNNKELYDMSKDPGQETNVIKQHPEVARTIRDAHKAYWQRVSPGDRDKPRFIVGHPKDPETFLQPADWYLSSVPWNHANVAEGKKHIGAWDIAIAEAGTYRFEVRRWPREANAPIQGIPVFKKEVDAWDAKGGKDMLIYGGKMKALPVESIQLEVGEFSDVRSVSAQDQQVVFDIPLKQGATQVNGTMLDPQGKTIAGAYYIYIRQRRPDERTP